MTNDEISIQDDDLTINDKKALVRTEEISVAGRNLMDTLGRLAREATVRRVTIKNASGKTVIELPFVLGAAGVLVLGPWTAALLGAAWLTRASILIEYEEAPETMKEAIREMPGISDEESDAATGASPAVG